MAVVTMEDEYQLAYGLSNSVIFNDVE